MPNLPEEPDQPLCRKCNKPVESFTVGKEFRRGHLCFFESECHGKRERVEYWPVAIEVAPFVPAHAFPAERPPAEVARAEAPQPERSVLTVQDELLEMPEWKRLARIQQFGVSIRLLERNAQELQVLLLFLTVDPRSMALSDVRRRSELDQVFEEVLRLLHNFVAAALTLVDHTRVVYRELYAKEGTFADYQGEVDRRFVSDPLIQFVQKLRHLAQHVRLPDISYNVSANQGSGITRRLMLNKADLLRFDGWNAPAKKYLEAAPDLIDLPDLLQAYSAAVRAFYRWMEERQRAIHASDIAAVQTKQAEGHSLLAREIPSLVEAGLSIWAQGVGSLQSIFAFGFSPADWVMLSKHEGDVVAWTEAALTLTQERFGALPTELLARIRKAAAEGKQGARPSPICHPSGPG